MRHNERHSFQIDRSQSEVNYARELDKRRRGRHWKPPSSNQTSASRFFRRSCVRRMCSAGSRVIQRQEAPNFINQTFVPLEAHIKEHPAWFKRFGAVWTPTILVMDSEGVERYRIEGYLPKNWFRARLEMGLARVEFMRKKFADAEKIYAAVVEPRRHRRGVRSHLLARCLPIQSDK